MATQRTEKGEAPVIGPTRASMKTTPAIKQEEFSMADSTQHSATRAITVPFHGADLYVLEHNGQPYTPMKPIAEGMGLDWGGQHKKAAANESRWGISVMEIPSAGGAQAATCILLRKLPAWLATIDAGRVKNLDARARVIRYQNECDDALWSYWNDGIAINPRVPYTVQPSDTLTDAQQQALRTMLETNVKRLPHNKQAGAMMQGWSKLKAHFGVPYRQIPAHEFTEALSIVARHVSAWELLEDEPKPAPAPALPPGKMVVDRQKLAAIWKDLGVLRARIDGLGILESDLPPSWWAQHRISAG